MNYYIQKFQRLLKKYTLDAIVVYANAYDDRYMKALSGTYSVLQNYLVVTANSISISEASYLVADLKKRTTLNIVSVEGENEVINGIKSIIGTNKLIGIVGNCKYPDIVSLEPKSTIDLNLSASDVVRYKSDDYINNLKRYARVTNKILTSIQVVSSINQLELSKRLQVKVINRNLQLAFPVCITSGQDIKISTSCLASNKIIGAKDMICIDMGVKYSIYTTDFTRMFFVNQPKAESLYQQIIRIHNKVIDSLTSNTRFDETIQRYRRFSKKYHQIEEVMESDLGHGIGFALHEKPNVESGSSKIGKNIVFTLEPTFITPYGRMRIEDMIAVNSKKEVIKIT